MIDEQRRDPEALLRRVQAAEAKEARGKLKIFFGAAPGVGKTYTMLEAGREQACEGVDVLVGYVEPHVRPETQALVLGLDVLARKEVLYRGTKLVEFDLDAALAKRPQLILVDELAHSNAPGMTHAKRWQDVMRLIEAGISVYTTLNVQHLESLNDVVAQITGITVSETVPDSVFEDADEVELVDLPADNLLERLREGKVYRPQQAERATQSFFKKVNLIALRELALRKAAEHVGAEMEDYREEHGLTGRQSVAERLLVCVGPSPFSARLVRATRRMARSLKASWIAVHVETPGEAGLSDRDRDQLSQTLNLVEQLGGETAALSGHNLADELIHYARSRSVSKIIVGKPSRPRWKEWLRGSLVYELTRKCGDIDVYVISGDEGQGAARAAAAPVRSASANSYFISLAMVVACTLVSWPLSLFLSATTLIMVYLLGVVAIATRFGPGPSILASVLSVAAFDFFFVPPFFTFAVHDTQYLFTFAVMLVTALTISKLTTRVTFQAESARMRERRTASLYAISHQLAPARSVEQVAQATIRQASEAVDGKVTILLQRAGDDLLVPVGNDTDNYDHGSHDQAVASWVFEHGEIAGHGTATLPGSAAMYLPLRASHGIVGVLGVLPNQPARPTDPDRLHLLETLAGLVALAVERVQLAAEAARIRVQMETEQLRSSLLSAVSHDLRTPLSVITGAASTLAEDNLSLQPHLRRELLDSILEEAGRLNRLVANLLDMTRLEAGAIEVHKDWQSLEEIVGATLGHLSQRLKDHPIRTHLQPDLPFVPMDDLLIQQVLVNLLENAVKYSPSGSEIELTAFASNTDLTVEVADRGCGLPPSELDQVFEKFFRASNVTGRPGAGLGLAICHGIVELHGGQIEAENRPGGGAVVRFTLPLAATQPEIPAVEPPLDS